MVKRFLCWYHFRWFLHYSDLYLHNWVVRKKEVEAKMNYHADLWTAYDSYLRRRKQNG